MRHGAKLQSEMNNFVLQPDEAFPALSQAPATEAVLELRSRVETEWDEERMTTSKPLPLNPNHADIVDWPADKPTQKEIALLIAREASFKPKPHQ